LLALIGVGLLAVASQAKSGAAASTHRPIGPLPDLASPTSLENLAGSPVAGSRRIPYLGGAVLHSSRVYLIFWQPTGSGLSFDPGYIQLVDQFAQDVAADSHLTTNVFALTGQYHDTRGPAAYSIALAIPRIDSNPLPSSGCTEPTEGGPGWSLCLTDAQIQQELDQVINTDHLPRGSHEVYVLLTPSGLGDCQDSTSSACALGGPHNGYCGYHSWTSSGIIYAVVPYNAVPGHCQSGNPRPNSSTADPALSTITHELVETVTDPYGNAWITSSGDEIADICLSNFGRAIAGAGGTQWNETINGHHYWLQEVYGRLQGRCEPRPRPDNVTISGPRRLTTGTLASFIARARQPGGTVRSYGWTFGDGHVAGGATVSHRYTRAGHYALQLRITDGADNWAFATATVRVTPPRRRAGAAQGG
jgi:hypothetical protein